MCDKLLVKFIVFKFDLRAGLYDLFRSLGSGAAFVNNPGRLGYQKAAAWYGPLVENQCTH